MSYRINSFQEVVRRQLTKRGPCVTEGIILKTVRSGTKIS